MVPLGGLGRIATGIEGAGSGAAATMASASKKIDRAVITSAGTPGAWNKLLNKPKPNTTYVVDGRFTYKTNVAGQVTEASTTLNSLVPGARNPYQQKIAGGPDRLPTDDGGHIFGTQFGGPGEGINLTAMKAELKSTGQRRYYKLEEEWAGAIQSGKTVDVTVKPVFSGTNVRPVRYDVEYQISGQLPKVQRFVN